MNSRNHFQQKISFYPRSYILRRYLVMRRKFAVLWELESKVELC